MFLSAGIQKVVDNHYLHHAVMMVDTEPGLEPGDQPLYSILLVPQLGPEVSGQLLAQLRVLIEGEGEDDLGLDGFVEAGGGGDSGPSSQGLNIKLQLVLLLQDGQVGGLNQGGRHPGSVLVGIEIYAVGLSDFVLLFSESIKGYVR